MHELADNALLRQYDEKDSESAFAALITRHVDKVYSVALRYARNIHAAEEITQAVFVILAKNSGRLGGKVILSGWLYETARLTALTYIRSEIRRARREQEAHMQTALNENDDETWSHIAPLLDDALAGLSAADHHAVVLRYFDGKSLGEVGAALGASEDAAKKRVTRAVEKLRGFFTKRGVTLTATVLTATISANSVQAAPLGLAATVTAAAVKGAAVSSSTLTLIKGALKIMAWTKMKTTIVVGVGAVLIGTSVYQAQQVTKLREQNQALQQAQAEQLQQLQRERDEATNQLAALREDNNRQNRNAGELLKLRGEVGVLRHQNAELATAKRQSEAKVDAASQPNDLLEQQKQMALAKGRDGRDYSMHFVLFASDNQGWFPTNWQQVAKYSKDYPVSGTNDFEMVHTRPIHQSELGTNAGKTILVREYQAWQTFDGKWAKIYGFADAHSEVIMVPDGNFTAWEVENTFNPESVPK